MRATNILNQLIVEDSRFQVLYNKLVKPKKKKGKVKPGLMDFEIFKTIILADPTTKVPEGEDIDTLSVERMENVKIGKYSQWLLKNFLTPKLPEDVDKLDWRSPEYKRGVQRVKDLFIEDLYKVTDDLAKFEKFKQYLDQDKRDINKYTVDSLFDTLENFEIPEKFRKNQEKKEGKKSRDGFKHAGGEILYEGNEWTLIKIEDKGKLGKSAAEYYGGFHLDNEDESRWCTSSPGTDTWFERYIKDGPLYVVFPNNDKGEVGKKTGLPKERYQFHFPSSSFMDRRDRSVNLVELLNGPMSELKEQFKSQFAKGLSSQSGEKVEVNYPDSSAGKFIALYGFEELFNSLPDNIERLFVTNKSKENIALDVPPSLGRFKNLSVLLFQNIVKTLPENIGELSKLTIISLPENKDLVALPESIVNLEDLSFIQLKGSNPNVKIPEDLLETLDDVGGGFYYKI